MFDSKMKWPTRSYDSDRPVQNILSVFIYVRNLLTFCNRRQNKAQHGQHLSNRKAPSTKELGNGLFLTKRNSNKITAYNLGG